jgi:AGCS family alanine or glycine:cation symporter
VKCTHLFFFIVISALERILEGKSMEAFANAVSTIDGILWGIPLIVILLGTHIFMTIRTGFVQKHVFKGIKLSVTPDPEGTGEVSQFGALATALAATIGTGNIVGVSTALISGGPGAILWMWLTGVFGMASKYGESYMSVKYRVQTEDGRMLGGAMYALERGLHQKWLAILFALFAALAAFGIGCMTQANSISTAFSQNFGIPVWITGIFVALLLGIVIIGGVKSITRVCSLLVPFMALFYVAGCAIILIMNGRFVGPAIVLICQSAFTPKAGFGGLAGFAVGQAIRYGCARGLFSNESGMGSAPLVAAAAKTKNPARQALVSMTGTFWDTIVICALSGLTLVSSVLKDPSLGSTLADKTVLTFTVFGQIPVLGKPLITIALALFAFSTLLGWSYYGERGAEYLLGSKVILPYKFLFVAMSFVGSVIELDLVWNIADILNGLMVIPNVIGMIALSGIIAREGGYYIKHIDEADNTEIPVIASR